VAAADADGMFSSAAGENMPLKAFTVPCAKAGYWYVALLTDLSLARKLEMPYKVDTGGTPNMGKVHNTSKFGFAAIPDSSGEGKYVFRVNENNTILEPRRPARRGRGRRRPWIACNSDVYLHFPDDASLKCIGASLSRNVFRRPRPNLSRQTAHHLLELRVGRPGVLDWAPQN